MQFLSIEPREPLPDEEGFLYRVDNGDYFNNRASVTKYKIISKTKLGVWIDSRRNSIVPTPDKWVSLYSRKRFAYPTQLEAFYSYIKRKDRQILICEGQIKNAKAGITEANRKIEMVKEIQKGEGL